MRKNLDQYMSRPDTKVIILTLTDHCNLACVYCYEHNKKVRSMDLQLALDIVEKEMTAEDGSNFVCVYYFGGEPYLEFEKIKKIHAFLKSRSGQSSGLHLQPPMEPWFTKNSKNGSWKTMIP